MENDQTGLLSWAAALTAQQQLAFAKRLAATVAAHQAEIPQLVEECHVINFFGEQFRNHSERPNGVTFMGRGTHSATVIHSNLSKYLNIQIKGP